MIVKQRTIPIEIIVNNALKRRLMPNHPALPAIEKDLYKKNAGHYGEEAMDYPLKMLSKKDYVIFHGLRLPYDDMHFQIDTLLLTTKFGMILESKNLGGELYFDESSEQLFQTYNGKKEGVQYPISQVQRQIKLLKALLQRNMIPVVPYDFQVVISHSSTILLPLGAPVLQKVCHVHSLHGRIEKVENRYKKDILDLKTLQKAARLLIKKHEPKKLDIKKKYGIEKNEILTGVHCPECSYRPMQYKKGKWLCPACQAQSKDAYFQGLGDYCLLINSTITNSELRRFLHLPTIGIAQKFLRSLNLPVTGKTKDREYDLQSLAPKN